MLSVLKRFLNDESGATAIEYCLMAAGIAMAIIGGVSLLSTKVSGLFNNLAAAPL